MTLKKLRKLKKVRQKEAADYLGNMKPGTYSAKENKGDFTEEEIILLAKLFKVNRSELEVSSISGSAHGTSHASGTLTEHINPGIQKRLESNSNELLEQVNSLMSIQRAQMELLISVCESQTKGGRNVVDETLKKFGLEDIFGGKDKLRKSLK